MGKRAGDEDGLPTTGRVRPAGQVDDATARQIQELRDRLEQAERRAADWAAIAQQRQRGSSFR